MTPYASALVARGRRAVAVDMPGHSESGRGLSSVIHFADVIAALADREGGFTSAIAHSLGAAAVLLARSGGVRFERLGFVAPAFDLPHFWAVFRSTFELSDAQWARLQQCSERWLGIPFSSLLLERLAAHASGPALILHDVGDREAPIDGARAMAARWSSAKLIETRELGHRRIVSDAAVVEALTAFIASEARN